jgi:hypothetical protein
MEAFILELGVGFAFLERQKRITVDGVDHYLVGPEKLSRWNGCAESPTFSLPILDC